METTTIDLLLRDFESGKMSRRHLIQSLAALGAAAALPGRLPARPTLAARPAPALKGFKTIALDHISYQVKDYRVTRDFYADLMGMKVSDDDPQRTQCYLHFGDAHMVIARNGRARRGEVVEPHAGARGAHSTDLMAR